jgi:hypothetical protein
MWFVFLTHDYMSMSEDLKSVSVHRAQIVACISRHITFHLRTSRTYRTIAHVPSTYPWGERGLLHHLQTLGSQRSVENWTCDIRPTDSEKTGANTGDDENRSATASSTCNLHLSMCATP